MFGRRRFLSLLPFATGAAVAVVAAKFEPAAAKSFDINEHMRGLEKDRCSCQLAHRESYSGNRVKDARITTWCSEHGSVLQ